MQAAARKTLWDQIAFAVRWLDSAQPKWLSLGAIMVAGLTNGS